MATSRPVSVGLNLSAGVLTTVYTVPTGYWAKWNLMYLFNNTASTKSIAAYWHDSSASADIYVNNGTVAAGGYLRQDGGAYVVLEEGDEIRCESELGSTMSVINTFELNRKP